MMYKVSKEIQETSNLSGFLKRTGHSDYEKLVVHSNEDPSWFWETLLNDSGIIFDTPYTKFFDNSDGLEHIHWCAGATLNITKSCLDRKIDEGHGCDDAISWVGETGETRNWTYTNLLEESNRIANALMACGVGKGDAVAIYMPMIPETAAAFMGIARLGAVVVPLFSGFAAPAIAVRLVDANVKVVLTVDATMRAGKQIPMEGNLVEALAEVPNVSTLISLRRFGGLAADSTRDLDWKATIGNASSDFSAIPMDSEDILMIAYTSGTTGKPKGVVQTHLGLMAKATCDFVLCLDLKPDDRYLWMTDMGWVMGPLTLVSAMLAGATLVLAEGAPCYPADPVRILRLIEEQKISNLGIAPTVVRQLMTSDIEQVTKFDLSNLRIVSSTGEAWNEEAWRWHYEHICNNYAVPLNIAGGTELVGGILTSTVLQDIKPAGFSGQCLAVGAKILRNDGSEADIGEVGELVMTNSPMGLTLSLWQDEDRYIDTYWSKYPGKWRHGDWAKVDADGTWYILGRSDDTINVAGKRVGPAEIEDALLKYCGISDAAAIGVPDGIKGVAVVCVCVLSSGVLVDDNLAHHLANIVAIQVGNPFRPREILFVSQLPKTHSMKTMRRLIRAVYIGDDLGDLTSLNNPESLSALDVVMKYNENQLKYSD